jgi:hypothetical protein
MLPPLVALSINRPIETRLPYLTIICLFAFSVFGQGKASLPIITSVTFTLLFCLFNFIIAKLRQGFPSDRKNYA